MAEPRSYPRPPKPVLHRLLDGSSLFLAAFALAAAIACYALKGPDVFWTALHDCGRLIVEIIPVIAGATLLGAMIQVIVPPAVVRKRLGEGTGVRGFLLAIGIGTVVPGGPMISMPILLGVLDAGADLAACVAFYLSWSLLAFTRLIQWEIPLMGPHFAALRYLASLPLPLIGAVTAAWLLRRYRHKPAGAP
jgi:uncharacterized membrane protein YraQ (UPF0718 family)